MNRQKDKITRLLSEITLLNAKKKSAEIETILTDYIPSVEKLMARMKKAGSAVKELNAEIAALKQEVDGSKASVQRQLELARKLQEFEALKQTVQDLEDEIAAIPPEIREKYNELIPTTQHILDSYDALTVEEKNSLWKLVMRRATIYREPEGEVHIHIYPNLPR